MEYDYRAQTAAPAMRDASLRNKADETQKYLHRAGDLLDELEGALHGPRPMEAAPRGSGEASHPGLRVTLEENSAGAAIIVSRLETLLKGL